MIDCALVEKFDVMRLLQSVPLATYLGVGKELDGASPFDVHVT